MSEVQKPHTKISSLPMPPVHGPKDNRYKKKLKVFLTWARKDLKTVLTSILFPLTSAIARKSTALTEIKNKPLLVLLLNFWIFIQAYINKEILVLPIKVNCTFSNIVLSKSKQWKLWRSESQTDHKALYSWNDKAVWTFHLNTSRIIIIVTRCSYHAK